MKIEAWGDYACFSRPEMKTERVSYDVMTPSAARGLIESIYWHPGMRYYIDKIYVLNPISFTNIRRNEVKSVVSASDMLSVMQGGAKEPALYTSSDIQQRAAMLLKNVRYVIEAHFEMTGQATKDDNPGKFQACLRRRLRKGQCYSQPYLGCREFSANFREWEGSEIPALDLNQDLGYMLYDMDFSNPEDIRARFFRARLEHGVLDCRNRQVVS